MSSTTKPTTSQQSPSNPRGGAAPQQQPSSSTHKGGNSTTTPTTGGLNVVAHPPTGSYSLLGSSQNSGQRRLSSTPNAGGSPAGKKTTPTGSTSSPSAATSNPPPPPHHLSQPGGVYNPRRLSTGPQQQGGGGGANAATTTTSNNSNPYHALLSGNLGGSPQGGSGSGGSVGRGGGNGGKSPSRLRGAVSGDLSKNSSSSVDSLKRSGSDTKSNPHPSDPSNVTRQSSNSSRNGSAGNPFPVGSGANAVSVLGNSRGPSPTTTVPHGSAGGESHSPRSEFNNSTDVNNSGGGHQLFPTNHTGSSHSLHSASSSSTGTQAPHHNNLANNSSSAGSVYSALGSAMTNPSEMKRDSNRSSTHSINGTSSTSLHSNDGNGAPPVSNALGTPAMGPSPSTMANNNNMPSSSSHLDSPNRSVQILRRISHSRQEAQEGGSNSHRGGGDAASRPNSTDSRRGLGSRSDSESSLRSVPSGLSLPTINIAISDATGGTTHQQQQQQQQQQHASTSSSKANVPSSIGSGGGTLSSTVTSNAARSSPHSSGSSLTSGGAGGGANTTGGSSLSVQEPELLFRKNSKYESPFQMVDSPPLDVLGAVGDHMLSSASTPSSASGSTSQAFAMSGSGKGGLLSVDQSSWSWDAPPHRGSGGGNPGRRVSLNGAAAAPAPNSTQARQRRLSSIYCEFAVKVEDFLRQPHVSGASSNSAETPRESFHDQVSHASHSSSPGASPQVGATNQAAIDTAKRVKPTLSGFSITNESVPNTSFGSASGVGLVGRSVSGGGGSIQFSAGASLSNLSVPMFQHSRRRSSRANAEPEEQHLSGSGTLLTLLDTSVHTTHSGGGSNPPPPKSPSRHNVSLTQADSRRTSPSRSSNGGSRKRSSGLRSLALRSLWELIDVGNVGEVSCDHLLAAFEKVGFQRVHSREKIKTMFSIADVNRNGKLNWTEFSKFFKHLASVDLLEAEDREEVLAKRRASSNSSVSHTMGRSVNASNNHVVEPTASSVKRIASSGSNSPQTGTDSSMVKPDYFSCSTTSSPSSPSESGAFVKGSGGTTSHHTSQSHDNPFSSSGEFNLEKHRPAEPGAASSGDIVAGGGETLITLDDTAAAGGEEDFEEEDDDVDLTDLEDDDDELSEDNIRKRQQALMQSYSNPISEDEQRTLEAAGPEAALMSASATTAVPLDISARDEAASGAGASGTSINPEAARRPTLDNSLGLIDAPMFSITIDDTESEPAAKPVNKRASVVAIISTTSTSAPFSSSTSGTIEQRVDPTGDFKTATSGILLGVEDPKAASIGRRPSVSYNPNTRRRISTCPAHRMKPTVLLRRYSVKILSGLRQRIKCIALAPRRPLIAACHRQENSVHIYDLQGNELRVLSGHKDSMLGVAFSVDRKAIATASRDKTVTVWDCTVGHELGVVEHPGIVTAIAFSADGKSFFTGCQDNLVRRFHTHKCRYLRCMETLPNSHQGVIVALAAQHHANELILCSRSCDKCALVLDAQTLEVVAALEGHSSMVWQAQFNADGSRIVTLCETSVIVWEASMLQPLQTFPSSLLAKHGFPKPMPLPNPKTGKKPKVKAKLWTTALFCPAPLGTLLACFGTDASVLFFDYISGELVLQLQLRSTAYCAAATDDGDRIVCGDDWGNLYQIMLSA